MTLLAIVRWRFVKLRDVLGATPSEDSGELRQVYRGRYGKDGLHFVTVPPKPKEYTT